MAPGWRGIGAALALAPLAAFVALAWVVSAAPAFEATSRPLAGLPATSLDGAPLPAALREGPAVALVWMPG